MLNRPATMNAVIERGVICARLGVLAGFSRGIQPNKSSGIKASQHSFQIEMHSVKWHNNRLKLTAHLGNFLSARSLV